MRPHRQQPTRLHRPWDSPGKSTGVGCHFLLQGMKMKRESEVAQSCPTLSDPMDRRPPGSSAHGICQARVLEWAAIAFSEMLSKIPQRAPGFSDNKVSLSTCRTIQSRGGSPHSEPHERVGVYPQKQPTRLSRRHIPCVGVGSGAGPVS